VTDLKAEENAVKREVEERASSAIRDLSEDVEALSERLKQHKLICFFCGTKMAP
jgi:RecB family exonuclease